MKKIIIILLLLPLWVKAEEKKISTIINQVTVFRKGAQVTRQGSTQINTGTHELIISGVSPRMRKESIQVKGEGNFSVLSVDYHVEIKDTRQTQDVEELISKDKVLEKRLEEIKKEQDVLAVELNILKNLVSISTNEKLGSVEMIIKAQEVARSKYTELFRKELDLRREMEDKQDQLNKVQQQLKVKRLPQQTVDHQIRIKVMAKTVAKADLTVSYLVEDAQWYPSYDVRVKNTSSPLVLEYKAKVTQQSGEDWENVKIHLSTGDPSITQTKPDIKPWYILMNQEYRSPLAPKNAANRYAETPYGKVQGRITDEYGEPLIGVMVMVAGTMVGTATDLDGNFSLVLPPNARQLEVSYIGYKKLISNINSERMDLVLEEDAVLLNEVVVAYNEPLINRDGSSSVSVTSVNRSPARSVASVSGSRVKKTSATRSVPIQVEKVVNVVNTEFKIEERYSIPSDKRNYSVSIKEIEVPANYQHYAAPRLDKDVFLTAMITEWEQYDLLEGQAQIFFEGTYIGNSLIDAGYVRDTLEISLGRDKKVIVERKKSKEYNRRQLIGNDQISSRNWDITVRNTRGEKIELVLQDQYPLTNDSRIEIKREEHSGGKLDEETGIITWTIDLESAKTEKKKLRYSVKYPKGNFVGLD